MSKGKIAIVVEDQYGSSQIGYVPRDARSVTVLVRNEGNLLNVSYREEQTASDYLVVLEDYSK